MIFFCYNKNDYCDHSENCDECDVFVKGKGGKEVPTNADRIRAMSDEELARCMLQFVIDCFVASGIENPKWNDGSEEKMIAWLKQPADLSYDK